MIETNIGRGREPDIDGVDAESCQNKAVVPRGNYQRDFGMRESRGSMSRVVL